jgi:hypothetical protein
MMKVLGKLLGKITREPVANKPAPKLKLKQATGIGDFRAVEISPSLQCCEAAKQASRKRYLLRNAPRVPLVGCTMPTTCSCTFRKNADRRDGDRRLLGAATSRWFAGVDNRKSEGRRLAKTRLASS